MSTTFAAAPHWYCAVLRRASAWLAATAQRLEMPPLDAEAPPAADGDAAFDARGRIERAEERLRELRLRSLRYY